MFEDVPLDTRHHKFKVRPKFPREWRMTEERRKFLDDTRHKSQLLDLTKEEAGSLISGKERIEQFFSTLSRKDQERVGVRLNRPITRGRQPSLRRI